MAYRSSRERAKDNSSTGVMFLVLGILGIVCEVVMVLFNPLNLTVFGSYMSRIMMGVVFLLMIWVGISSLLNGRKYIRQASEEEAFQKELKDWCQTNLTREAILQKMEAMRADSEVVTAESEETAGDTPDELDYFRRTESIKALITAQFPNLDAEFLEDFTDKFDSEVFGA